MGFFSGLGTLGGLGGALNNENDPPSMNDFARYVGDITIKSNQLQIIYHAFVWKLLKVDDTISKALWEYASQDKSQRIMLRVFIPLLKGTDVQEALAWSINAADKLGEIRNAFVHTPIVNDLETGKFAPLEFASKNSHKEKFKIFKNRKSYAELLKDYDNLDNYTFLLFKRAFDKRRTFPEKPLLKYAPNEKKDKKF